MLQRSDSETEILLGNKQLLGIFLAVAVLLGVAFTGGFLVGRGSGGKKVTQPEAAAAAAPEGHTASTSPGGQTHTLEGETTLPAAASGGADAEAALPPRSSEPATITPKHAESALGSRRTSKASLPSASTTQAPDAESRYTEAESGYSPRAGSMYLQVAAVGKDEAETVADVLHKKGFHAHAVPKPGNAKIYRVLIGPVKDAGDLSSTRDALRKTFREVIVQRY